MKKLLMALLLVNNFVSHAAAEKQKFVRTIEKVVLSEEDYDLIEIERLLSAGVDPDTPLWVLFGEQNALCRAFQNYPRESAALLAALLVRKGARVDDKVLKAVLLPGENPFLSFEQRKAAILAFIDGGVRVDLDSIQRVKVNGIKRIEHFERVMRFHGKSGDVGSGFSNPVMQRALRAGMRGVEDAAQFGFASMISRAQWEQLEQIIKSKMREGAQWRQELPVVLGDDLPAPLISIVGGYAYPYYDYQETGQERVGENQDNPAPEICKGE